MVQRPRGTLQVFYGKEFTLEGMIAGSESTFVCCSASSARCWASYHRFARPIETIP
jgi:hypothetical protein